MYDPSEKYYFAVTNGAFTLMQHDSLPRVAFLGTGLMGRPMALRVVASGFPLTVWNRSREKAEQVSGARVAATPAEAVADADCVITMLQDGAAVAAVVDQSLGALRRGTVVIDMSSTAQAEAIALASTLAPVDVTFVDAPVSGGVVGAELGQLAIMAGGSEQDFARVERLLSSMGRPTHVGSIGCGQLAKLCNQLIVGGTLNIVAEALLLAQAGGADPAAVRSAIRGGFAESRILEVHGQRMLDRNFVPGGQVKSQLKDLENVLRAAESKGLNLPVTELVTERYRALMNACPEADQSAALLALERINPGVRLGMKPDRLA